jgi:hypothetical protein
VTLTPGRHFGFQTVFAQNCDKLLNSGAFSGGQRTIRLPVQHLGGSRSIDAKLDAAHPDTSCGMPDMY